MSEITLLSPHVADLIAAGEVVERPASVIKELLENAFDAGAGTVTVEIKGGGMTYIRVTDDGNGMLPEDAGVCFLRHATSKLRDERGLEAIGTMGFRGEALAAISAVSRATLLTRKKGTDIGTRVTLEAGDILDMTQHGCPEGTTLIIRDLFYNTPARLKFMKSDRTEGSACVLTALRCALGRPETSVRLIKDGEELFFSPGDGKMASCVYSLLGRETALELLSCSGEGEGVAVGGFVGSPKAGHGNRTKQYFFCNGRSIKSPLLQAAVEQAYKNTLLTGRYPACVIYLKLSPASVDVNVHPAKTEVRFRDEKQVFDAVYYAALSAVENESPSAEIRLSSSAKAASPKKDFYKTMSAGDYREKYAGETRACSGTEFAASRPVPIEPGAPLGKGTILWDRRPLAGSDAVSGLRESKSPYLPSPTIIPEQGGGQPMKDPAFFEKEAKLDSPFFAAEILSGVSSENASNASFAPEQGIFPAHLAAPTLCAADESPALTEAQSAFRLVGEAMKTYIIVEKDGELIFIDKHAAHERIIFDRLKTQGREIMSQALMLPVTMKLTQEEMALIEKNTDTLLSLGFEIEPYGMGSVVIRAIPSDTDASDAAAMVEEICEKLKKSAQLTASDASDEILHTIACKAAIKAGWRTAEQELMVIAQAVISGEVKYCPHGRPVSTTLTKKQLDRAFSRIV